MKARHRRFAWIAVGVLVLAVATALVLNAFKSSLVVFHTPSEVAENKVPSERAIRLGGLVLADSVKRQADGLTVRFVVTDTVRQVPVRYTGILPDLFKEGKGVVAQGKIGPDGEFVASEILAKHDENYMAPEAAEALRKAGHPIKGEIFAGQKPVTTQAAGK
jgi:cytochrome c-type biogenesis protein CcmE